MTGSLCYQGHYTIRGIFTPGLDLDWSRQVLMTQVERDTAEERSSPAPSPALVPGRTQGRLRVVRGLVRPVTRPRPHPRYVIIRDQELVVVEIQDLSR